MDKHDDGLWPEGYLNKKGLTGWIFFCAFLLIILSAIVYGIYLEVTEEYKYTAIIPCYDKYGNEIVNLSCEKDVICGNGQNYDNDDSQSYPCDHNKYDGLVRTSKHRSKQ